MFATPTFEVNSVIEPINMEMIIRTRIGLKCRRGSMVPPTLFAKQEATLPLDIANPPPRRNMRLQGILLWITFHVIKPSEGPSGLLVATQNAVQVFYFAREMARHGSNGKEMEEGCGHVDLLTVSAATVNKTRISRNEKHQEADEYNRRGIPNSSVKDGSSGID